MSHSFKVFNSILSLGYRLYGISVHVNQPDQFEAVSNDNKMTTLIWYIFSISGI